MALFQSIIEISLAIEIYEFLHNLPPAVIMGDIIKLNKPPNTTEELTRNYIVETQKQ